MAGLETRAESAVGQDPSAIASDVAEAIFSSWGITSWTSVATTTRSRCAMPGGVGPTQITCRSSAYVVVASPWVRDSSRRRARGRHRP